MKEQVPEPGAELRGRSPLRFFLLVFALSTPIWLLGAVTRRQLTADLPVSSFVWVCPVVAASLLVHREQGAAGVAGLLRRALDWRRIRHKGWYVPVVLLPPGIYAATYGVLWLLDRPLPVVRFPVLAAAGQLVAYLVAAECEELGWTGYALGLLQERWNALWAGVGIGMVWAGFHLLPLVQHGRSVGWIAWWTLGTVGLRVLLTWICNNTGRSVFAAALFHAVGNLSSIGPFLDFGPGGYPYDAQRISALLTAAAAALVTVVWGPRTLAGRARSCRGRLVDHG
jgi:uncharacterized protein